MFITCKLQRQFTWLVLRLSFYHVIVSTTNFSIETGSPRAYLSRNRIKKFSIVIGSLLAYLSRNCSYNKILHHNWFSACLVLAQS